jgi:hypothetical protein
VSRIENQFRSRRGVDWQLGVKYRAVSGRDIRAHGDPRGSSPEGEILEDPHLLIFPTLPHFPHQVLLNQLTTSVLRSTFFFAQ